MVLQEADGGTRPPRVDKVVVVAEGAQIRLHCGDPPIARKSNPGMIGRVDETDLEVRIIVREVRHPLREATVAAVVAQEYFEARPVFLVSEREYLVVEPIAVSKARDDD
nr:hypothetical protein [Micrococcus luteus]